MPKEIIYDVFDLMALRILLEASVGMKDSVTGIELVEKMDVDGFDFEVLEVLRTLSHSRPLTQEDLKDCLSKWVEKYRDNVDVKTRMRVLRFVFYEPLDEVPLKINDPIYLVFARWRLKICK
jgi:hypothetical protein